MAEKKRFDQAVENEEITPKGDQEKEHATPAPAEPAPAPHQYRVTVAQLGAWVKGTIITDNDLPPERIAELLERGTLAPA